MTTSRKNQNKYAKRSQEYQECEYEEGHEDYESYTEGSRSEEAYWYYNEE